MLLIKDYLKQNGNRDARRAYRDLEKYILSGKWSNYRKAEEAATLFLSKSKDERIAQKLGISKGSIEVTKHNLSKSLYQLFGSDFLLMFYDYDNNAVKIAARYNLVTNRTITLPKDILYKIDEMYTYSSSSGDDFNVYGIKECTREVQFVMKYCNFAIDADLSKCDISKLKYVLSLLDDKVPFENENKNLLYRRLLNIKKDKG